MTELQCPDCDKSFEEPEIYEHHREEHPIYCPLCGRRMSADIHCEPDFDSEAREWDNWWCGYCHILIGREELRIIRGEVGWKTYEKGEDEE